MDFYCEVQIRNSYKDKKYASAWFLWVITEGHYLFEDLNEHTTHTKNKHLTCLLR